MNVKHIIYDLKRRHGEQIQVHDVSTTNHPATGVPTTTGSYYTIRQAIVDQETVTKLAYYLQAQDKFKEGGFYQIGDLLILIDKNDLAVITPDFTVIYKDERYDIVTVSLFHDMHLLKVRKVQSQEKITFQDRGNALAMVQTVGYELV